MLARDTANLRRAYTLLEVLIVVILLALLSAMMLPKFSVATESRQATLEDLLRYMRTQVAVFKAQHHEIPPGYPGGDPRKPADAVTFVQQMTRYSDDRGNTHSAHVGAYRFGPYLPRVPANPFTGFNGVWVVNGPDLPAPDESQPYGWIYNPRTQQLVPNLQGYDGAGAADTGE